MELLLPGDLPALEAFLASHADSSMFLRSNVRRAGLVDEGKPFQATYVASRASADGAITGVAAACWNGLLLLQAPADDGSLARAAAARSPRPITGFLGPWAQITTARAALALPGTPRMDSREELFALALADLVVPAPLADGRVRCRPPRDDDHELVAAWRVAYCVEALHEREDDALRRRVSGEITSLVARKAAFVLEHDGRAVAFSAFNADLPDMVQIGGVYTPPELRGRGLARAVVAGSLVAARERGVERAILFTGDDNVAAASAYRAIGFRVVGDYGIVMY
jgi:ribosomal protein S18 acetylase RimI-like enzyme